ncbi:uncharacterized protein EI97DRAFT_448472 [Westerdykella ornata]|uniref:Uncharacterized protein n=1 Tax=Westerdykella ornata TaxID=318751 RepID=A0A6A6JU59_WESOR|nr:uncharacterized protein EI97DRAFT_448472 [Westerdykella ornata]KAF2278569.1 hypothetical protein EI97DRAFT_448472 [Westerdykella ornata]
MNSRTSVVAVITLTIPAALYLFQALFQPDTMEAGTPGSPVNEIPGLQFNLSQISKNPPTLLVTVRNGHPSSTYTFLKWDSPLDPQATNLGVFKLLHVPSGNEVATDLIRIRRKMPPSRDDLQEIAPGTQHSMEIVLDKPWMPKTKPTEYKIWVEGEFHGVWEKAAGSVKDEELEAYTDTNYDGSRFRSEATTIIVE